MADNGESRVERILGIVVPIVVLAPPILVADRVLGWPRWVEFPLMLVWVLAVTPIAASVAWKIFERWQSRHVSDT